MSLQDYNFASGSSMYQFWLGDLLIPLAPDYHKHYYRSSSKTLASIDHGELLIRNDPGLLEYSFTFYLPMSRLGYNMGAETLKNIPTNIPVVGTLIERINYSPDHYLDTLIYYKNSQEPFTYTVIRGIPQLRNLFTTSALCILDSLTIHERSENGLMLSIDVTLKEYKRYKTKTYTKVGSTIKMISENREETTWYDMGNYGSFINCGVKLLEKEAEKAKEYGRNMVSKAVSMISNSTTNLLSNRLSEPMVHGVKLIAWKGIKTALTVAFPLLGVLL